MITARISFEHDEALERLLDDGFRHPRASYTARREGERLVVEVEARDATALKTAVSSIARVAAVHEKAGRWKRN